MKKIILLFTLVVPLVISAQSADDAPQRSENIFEQMQKMQRELFKNFNMLGDSTEGGIMRMDTSFSKSFGMIFDGEKWRSMMPNDTTTTNMFQQLEERMSKMKDGFDFSEMFKGFSEMFGDGFNFDMQSSPMPRVKPKEKERKGEGEKKEKNYSTEGI